MINALVMMYVFFDDQGDIKAITPTPEETYLTKFNVATFPLDDVKSFLTFEENTFNYFVRSRKKPTGTVYSIVSKKHEIDYTRTSSSYLTEVQPTNKDSIICITHHPLKKSFTVSLDAKFKKMYLRENDPEDTFPSLTKFFASGPCSVYITKKHNPYCMLWSFRFLPSALLSEDSLNFTYSGVYNNVSVYTKKIITGYGYSEE